MVNDDKQDTGVVLGRQLYSQDNIVMGISILDSIVINNLA